MNIFSSLFGNKLPIHLDNFHDTEPEVNKWVISDFIINKIVPIVGVRPYPLSELELLVSVMLWYQPSHVCDWGTHVGKATRLFYETSDTFNLKSKIISIDLPEDIEHVEHPHGNRGKMVRGIPQVKLLLGDGATTALKHLGKYSTNKVRPLFFLDGDHSYASVIRELNMVGRAYPNGAIIIHDTFYQSKESKYNIGPYQAVIDYLQKHPRYKILQTNLGLPGMTALLPQNDK